METFRTCAQRRRRGGEGGCYVVGLESMGHVPHCQDLSFDALRFYFRISRGSGSFRGAQVENRIAVPTRSRSARHPTPTLDALTRQPNPLRMGALSRSGERRVGVSEGSRTSGRTSGDDGAHPGRRRAAIANGPKPLPENSGGADDACTTSPLSTGSRVVPPLKMKGLGRALGLRPLLLPLAPVVD